MRQQDLTRRGDVEVELPLVHRMGLVGAVAVGALAAAHQAIDSWQAGRPFTLGMTTLMIVACTLWAVSRRAPLAAPRPVPAGPSQSHVFVSYSRHDSQYVRRLVAFLRDAHINVWMDDQIPNGTRWDKILKEKIDMQGLCVVA